VFLQRLVQVHHGLDGSIEPGQQLVANDEEFRLASLLAEGLLDSGFRVAVEVVGLKVLADPLSLLVLAEMTIGL
jgi:hypothetical protein